MKNMIRNFRKKDGYFGAFSSWEQAAEKCRGYDDQIIVDRVVEKTKEVMSGKYAYERDGVGFVEPRCEHHILSYLFMAYAERETLDYNVPFVCVDWGGAMASVYLQHRSILARFFPDMKWVVVEQKKFADAGKKLLTSLSGNIEFIDAEDENNLRKCLEIYKPGVTLLRGTLQYIPDWRSVIDIIKSFEGLYVVIDRVALAKESRICIQKVPKSIYPAEYPVRIFTKEEIVSQMEGYELMEEDSSSVDCEEWAGNLKVEYRMLCFSRSKDNVNFL